MDPMPRRISLVTQCCVMMREWLQAGEWTDMMPGEAELGRRLRVSRVTLRAALARLEAEGLLRSSNGRRREILTPAARPCQSQMLPTRVALLSPVAHARLTAWKLLWIDELREELMSLSLPFEFIVSAAASSSQPGRALRDLTARHPDCVWVLLKSSARTQLWFAEAGLPVVVAGSRFEGTQLPCVDMDYFATCRHAAGRLIARGCEGLGLVIPRILLAGDQESEAGFFEGAGGHPVAVARHDGTPDGLCRALDALMESPAAPQGLLVCHSTHAVTVLTRLLQNGCKLPRQVKLISRDDDPFLEHVTPVLSRYTLQPRVFASHIARRVFQAQQGEKPVIAPDFLLPEFSDGGTI